MNPTRSLYSRLPVAFRSGLRSAVPDRLLRWYSHRNTDVYLISYPKCGRTWLRLMMGRAISRHFNLPETEEVLFLRSNRRYHAQVPRLMVIHDNRPMLRTPEELETSKARYRTKKVIFLARDPRDVIVSSYFEMKNRGRLFGDNPYEKHSATFDGSLPEFIQQQRGGFDTLLAYYNIWAHNRHLPQDFLLVRYEDMKADPGGELRRVLDFLGLQAISQTTIDEAVNYASFENMRKMESEGRFQNGMLRPADQADRDSYKTRSGKTRGYLDHLSPSEIENLNKKMNEKLEPYFGYTGDAGLAPAAGV
jgi:hypothetical protein